MVDQIHTKFVGLLATVHNNFVGLLTFLACLFSRAKQVQVHIYIKFIVYSVASMPEAPPPATFLRSWSRDCWDKLRGTSFSLLPGISFSGYHFCIRNIRFGVLT